MLIMCQSNNNLIGRSITIDTRFSLSLKQPSKGNIYLSTKKTKVIFVKNI